MAKTKYVSSLQLCLFSEAEMVAMAEDMKPVKAITPFISDNHWVQWQIEIGRVLRGQEGRTHFRMLTQRKRKTRVIEISPLARTG